MRLRRHRRRQKTTAAMNKIIASARPARAFYILVHCFALLFLRNYVNERLTVLRSRCLQMSSVKVVDFQGTGKKCAKMHVARAVRSFHSRKPSIWSRPPSFCRHCQGVASSSGLVQQTIDSNKLHTHSRNLNWPKPKTQKGSIPHRSILQRKGSLEI